MIPEPRSIRPAAVAGTFYPAEPISLRRQVLTWLAAKTTPTEGRVQAIIAPHAGYVYSGDLCGLAYASTTPDPDRLWLLGPSHHRALPDCSGLSASGMATPLGTHPVDPETQSWPTDDEAHRPEHCLETQLPFVSVRWPALPVIPLLTPWRDDPELAIRLERRLRPKDLLAVSSDLSHFLPDAEARRTDRATARAIETLDPEGVRSRDACGWVAIRTLLRIARRRGWRVERLGLHNSSRANGDTARVVGYGAWRFIAPETEDLRLLHIARQAIEDVLDNRDSPPPHHLPESLLTPGAAFVTLRIDGELRGCIGSLTAHRPLAEDVRHNAIAAAFEDPRFPPLSRREFERTTLEISILSPPEPFPVRDEADLLSHLRPGIDGLILEDATHRATFLPSVWEELPAPRDFLRQLKHKAGLPADHDTRLLRFHRYTTRIIPTTARSL